MKIKLLFLAGIIATVTSNADAQNVGIGTLTPQYKLDVVGRTRIQAGTVNDIFTTAGTWFTDYRSNTNMVFIGMVDSVNYGFWSQRNNAWQFFFDARYGNVGIGRPASSGSGRLSLDHPSGASLNVYANGSYRGGFQGTDSTLEIFGSYGSSLVFPNTPGKDMVFWPPPPPCTGQFCILGQTPGRMGMYVNTPKSRVHMAVGTGLSGVLLGSTTSVPATGYMLSVDGKIICEELKVQVSGSWPDYVFDHNYPLLPLDQLQQQVMNEKHLPGIPSANDVKASNGIEVSDMQKKLLEKVEELYRYTFELNEKNKKLEGQIAELQNELKKQKQ